ncbi:MAG: hypothetical protein KJO30_03920 [Boseongicola sp.]|nr:hypothetical protein [Boseongicola sp.]
MTLEAIFVLAVLVVAIGLIAFEVVAIDLVAIAMLIAVVAAGVLSPADAFSGFASETVIMLAAIFVIAGTIARAGLAEAIAGLVLRRAKGKDTAALAIIMSISAALSTVFSNTSTTSVLTPAAIAYAKQAGTSASKLLMPLAFASMMGGTMTLIGTSTNLSASGMIAGLGLEPYGFLEFSGIGAILAVCGIAFMLGPGAMLIPERRQRDLTEGYGVRDYLSELVFPDDSKAIGCQITELELNRLELTPLHVLRGQERLSAHHLRKIQAQDRMLVKGTLDGLLRAREDKRFVIEPDIGQDVALPRAEFTGLGEAVVMPGSRLVGRRLGSSPFFHRFRLVVLAVHRRGRAYGTRLDDLRLQAGDVLLLQGASDDLSALKGHPDLWGLSEVGPPRPTLREGLLASGLLAIAVVFGILGILPLSIALLSVIVCLAIAGITPIQEAYRMIDWRLLVMVACMIGFGLAMYQSGAADALAAGLVGWIAPFGLMPSLFALAFLTVALTQPMSNAAAALTMLPVAVSSAELLQIDPRPVVILVTLAASLSFIAPLEPALLIVYGPGRYRFVDFIRVGGPLTVFLISILVLLVPWFWPLVSAP